MPFEFDHIEKGHIVVAARINGSATRLVFDTGAASYLPPSVAEHYGLKPAGGVDIGGVGETSFTGSFARVALLEIGNAKLINSSTIVAPLPEAALKPRPDLELQGLNRI